MIDGNQVCASLARKRVTKWRCLPWALGPLVAITLLPEGLSRSAGWDFPDGPVVKDLPCTAGDVGWILVGELKSHILWSNWACAPLHWIHMLGSHVVQPESSRNSAPEPVRSRDHALQLESLVTQSCTLQLLSLYLPQLVCTMQWKFPPSTTKTLGSQVKRKKRRQDSGRFFFFFLFVVDFVIHWNETALVLHVFPIPIPPPTPLPTWPL